MNLIEGDLNTTLEALAHYLAIDAETLKAYADEDVHTGWDFGEGEWECSSLHRPEGQTLYALVRYYRPEMVLEYGRWTGCSTTHIAEALEANGAGRVISCDIYPRPPAIPERLLERCVIHAANGLLHLDSMASDHTFIWEDTDHSYETTRRFWELAIARLKPGGIMVSHDVPALERERRAIEDAGVTDYIALRVPPSDCGLGVWIKR